MWRTDQPDQIDFPCFFKRGSLRLHPEPCTKQCHTATIILFGMICDVLDEASVCSTAGSVEDVNVTLFVKGFISSLICCKSWQTILLKSFFPPLNRPLPSMFLTVWNYFLCVCPACSIPVSCVLMNWTKSIFSVLSNQTFACFLSDKALTWDWILGWNLIQNGMRKWKEIKLDMPLCSLCKTSAITAG